MRIYVEQVGLLAPGLPGWEAGQAILGAPHAWSDAPMPRPAADLLPPTERRRASETVRLAVTVAGEAMAGQPAAPAVFGCCHGDGAITRQICAAVAEASAAVSPTQFHNSVHNAPAGYWSIARRSTLPTVSVSAGDETAAAALLEAATQASCEARPVLLVVYDVPLPAPLDTLHPTRLPFAAAFLLTPAPTPRSLAAWTLSHAAGAPDAPPIDAFAGNPAARCLPLLAALAAGRPAAARLPRPGGGVLLVEHAPC